MEQFLAEMPPEGFAPPPDELVYGQERFDRAWDDDQWGDEWDDDDDDDDGDR
jgi:hypothetical protein